ncbi:Abi family protein [Bifidobacterium longum subsp. suillum]|uniref:Abi family protein n=2 Tax=Bifidobacterium longum TaxID=216816 RepID=UPI00197CD43F|nr:Abi family protein [Bifidobacterium longum]QSG86156.1 Abi family protein [Bifidobacterium longum subsp. suillum]
MRRPKYSVSQQIESLKSHGVTFNLYTEADAQEFLTSRTYFFKLKAFENNFERDNGRYRGLDFAYLADLSTIDCHLRTLLSYLCLNLEHALKVRFNQLIMEDANEDGYNIVHNFDEAGEFSFHGDYANSRYHHSNYTEGLLNKYFEDPSIWNLWEVIDFSTLCKLYKAYLNQRSYKDNATNLFQSIRIMRNASSHNNCLMIGIEKQIKPTLYVKNCVKELNHGENPKQLFDAFRTYPLTHDFAATICGFLILVDSPGVRNTAKLKTQDFLHRLTKRYDYSAMSYQDCPKLIETINALQSICKMAIDYFGPFAVWCGWVCQVVTVLRSSLPQVR